MTPSVCRCTYDTPVCSCKYDTPCLQVYIRHNMSVAVHTTPLPADVHTTTLQVCSCYTYVNACLQLYIRPFCLQLYIRHNIGDLCAAIYTIGLRHPLASVRVTSYSAAAKSLILGSTPTKGITNRN